MNILTKIIFFFKKPKIVIVTGKSRKVAAEAIFCLLKQYFRVERFSEKFPNISSVFKKEILILGTDLKNSTRPPLTSPKAMSGEAGVEKFKFLVKKSQLPILLVTQVGDIPSDKDFFAGEKKDVAQEKKLAKILPTQGYLILNFDDETVREIKDETNLKDCNPPTTSEVPSRRVVGGSESHPPRGGRAPITFGFQEGADFRATDIKLNSNTNFKIDYKGNIVPVWLARQNFAEQNLGGLARQNFAEQNLGGLEKIFGKEQIYSALAAAAVGIILGLNLVEISSALKNYKPPLGEI